ncbi:putative transcription factor bHLH family [Helianthus annuus]|uniref:Putative myc-type, basic helix-loop-helix (BHLH) domain-containing protein n=1 Tax=Helianthus annuus TaxID=4232 RepID=A0A251RTH5_HELAN|nr:transcription factor bHLH130 isoform X1 [Helianthus annuus]KAF5756697.1 putative transcription factor bHLH family [Helianthus annuus]KAJ0430162.1 putative transcription factor bHLH family [Helianthus annuus]
MYGDAISRDMNSVLHSNTLKHPPHGEFAKIKQLISLDPYPDYDYQNQTQNQHESDENYGQTQSSFFSNLLRENGDNEERFLTRQQLKEEKKYMVVKREREAGANQNLVRQNSTPAGFISALTAENGIGSMKKGIPPSTLNNHISFSSGPSSSTSRLMPQIAGNKNNVLKRSIDGVLKMPQNVETRNHTPNLVHHMSLPNTSSEMAVVDNFLHFQQESTVPWRTRAKRGFATHPRSIAERVRRTRISERIKRLQDLFPDIDKHSNTADMLDMAVEYIKNLQKELQTLNDARARCQCSSKQLRSM